MKRIISIILAMGIIFSFGFSSFAVQDIELEEKIISRLITSFFEACKRKDIAKAKSMTTDKEKKIFESILKESKKTNGILPADLSKYFSRLRDFKVNVVQLDESGDKAVAICTYEFKYYDSKSKDEIRKD
ncbi:MAG: hypothetical protein OEV44_01480, partial [Spirochaetota bacterium]|nr:hypothetical protein [Spirochaetota bacterium]